MAPITSSDSRGIAVLVLIVLFTIAASLAVWGRFWSRSAKKVSLAASDHVILIALVRTPVALSSCVFCLELTDACNQIFTWGFAILNIVGCTLAAYGQHIQVVTAGELHVLGKVRQTKAIAEKKDKMHWDLLLNNDIHR